MANNGKDKVKVHERLAVLETQMETILDNHLPHLKKQISGLSKKFWAFILIFIANLFALIFDLYKIRG